MSPPAEGSRLCLACGLCCRGVLHDHAELAPGETGAARRLGLAVISAASGPALALPCPRHDLEAGCTVYAERPSVCRAYRCRLLRRHLAGEVELDAALAVVARARRLNERLESWVGPGPGTLWQRARSRLDGADRRRPATRQAMLDMAELLTLTARRFKDRRHEPAASSGEPLAAEVR